VVDGYQVFKYPNGTISSEGLMRDGKPDGFWKSYYVTGVKKSKEREQFSARQYMDILRSGR
jgi:uncharacterized protein